MAFQLSQIISLVQTEVQLIILRAMWDKYVVHENIKSLMQVKNHHHHHVHEVLGVFPIP
jgi:hypothetical protein